MAHKDVVQYTIVKSDASDAETLAGVINAAFGLEQFFVHGDRISPEGIRRLIAGGGTFFALKSGGETIATVYTEPRGSEKGYIGMLAVTPGIQGRSIGSRLMKHAEDHLAREGATTIEITVVDLRTELFPFYEKRGYRRVGVDVFPRAAKRPCQLIVMTKALT